MLLLLADTEFTLISWFLSGRRLFLLDLCLHVADLRSRAYILCTLFMIMIIMHNVYNI